MFDPFCHNVADPCAPIADPSLGNPAPPKDGAKNFFITNDIAFTRSFLDPPDKISKALEYFKQFLSKECMKYIAHQSNLYAAQKDGKVLGTSFGEIEQFIGIFLLTGVFPCTSYRLYWANFCWLNMIADVMSRNRFELLL